MKFYISLQLKAVVSDLLSLYSYFYLSAGILRMVFKLNRHLILRHTRQSLCCHDIEN